MYSCRARPSVLVSCIGPLALLLPYATVATPDVQF